MKNKKTYLLSCLPLFPARVVPSPKRFRWSRPSENPRHKGYPHEDRQDQKDASHVNQGKVQGHSTDFVVVVQVGAARGLEVRLGYTRDGSALCQEKHRLVWLCRACWSCWWRVGGVLELHGRLRGGDKVSKETPPLYRMTATTSEKRKSRRGRMVR